MEKLINAIEDGEYIAWVVKILFKSFEMLHNKLDYFYN